MKTIDLKGTVRQDVGKKATKQIRQEELVPCVLYGQGEPMHFTGVEKEFGRIIYTPNAYQVNLEIDGKVFPAIMKAVQFHPVHDNILHMDFQQIVKGKPVSVSIPVRLEGFAKGVQQGGKLKLEKRRITLKGDIEKIPDELVLDVTNIEIGQSIKVRDLTYTDFDILDPMNSVIASVKTTRAARAAADSAAKA